ncbi:MAG: tetratricopeptide repeat protein [Pseudomonadota bacterium]
MRNFLFGCLLLATPLQAQDAQTLADIRQELTVVFVEMQKLRRELSTTGGVSANLAGTNALQRLDAMEAELQRLTAATERLTNRVDRVVADGTNRIGDLEFRLCELETGCDIASLGETPTLGGGELPAASGGARIEGAAAPAPAPWSGSSDIAGNLADLSGVELAFAEKEDFERAKASYDGGNFEGAAEQFQRFTDTYQGGPLTGLAHLMRGESLSKLGLNSSAAQAYLESYSGTPNGPTSSTALLKLGVSLNQLGQTQQACITLNEVTLRFPSSDASLEAQAARASMGCS